MSEFTKCNWCSLGELVAKYGEDRLTMRTVPDARNWIGVYLDDAEPDEPIALFLELSTTCVC